MPCGWKDNRRSVAHAVRHRLKWFIHLRAHGLNRDKSIQPTLLTGYRTLYNFTYGIISGISLLIPRHHRVSTVQLMFTLGLRRLPCASLRRNSSFVGMETDASIAKKHGPPGYLSEYSRVRLYHATRSTQPCIPPGSLNRVPVSVGVRAGMSPLPGGR